MNLIKKYDVPGPRYTSYPTVPQWKNNLIKNQWIEKLNRACMEDNPYLASQTNGISIYIHIPFCRNLCTYCGCNVSISKDHSIAEKYMDYLVKEWSILRDLLPQNLKLSEIHFGGGSPNFLNNSQLDKILNFIFSTIQVEDNREFSVEIDPRISTVEQLENYYRWGFRRLSMGVQDFDPVVQKSINRVQSAKLVKSISYQAKKMGFYSVNHDLIYGLPFQTLDSIKETMTNIADILPDRLAFYSYAHVPWIKPSQRLFSEADLPTGREKRSLYETGKDLLSKIGYRELGMDHFSLPTDSLYQSSLKGELHRNFMGYTSRRIYPIIGLGVSSISDSYTAYSQNKKDLKEYYSSLDQGKLPLARGHQLTKLEMQSRKINLELMTAYQCDISSYPTEIISKVELRLQELIHDDLIIYRDYQIKITDKGKPFIRNISMAVDPKMEKQAIFNDLSDNEIFYLNKKSENTKDVKQYSQTI